jgi:Xaa-Pro aminopeptidase
LDGVPSIEEFLISLCERSASDSRERVIGTRGNDTSGSDDEVDTSHANVVGVCGTRGDNISASNGVGISDERENTASGGSGSDDEVDTSHGNVVGLCGEYTMAAEYNRLVGKLNPHGITVKNVGDLIVQIWASRPEPPRKSIFLLDSGNGESKSGAKVVGARIAAVRGELAKRGADATLICALESVAWLFGFRGSDIANTPVAYARAFVSQSEAILFIDACKVSVSVMSALTDCGVSVQGFGDVGRFLGGLPCGTRLIYDPHTTNIALRASILGEGKDSEREESDGNPELSSMCSERIEANNDRGVVVHVEEPDPVYFLKAIKTDAEIENLRRCHERDGRTMVRFFIWLEQNVGRITEFDAAVKISELRAQDSLCFGDSFEPICAFGANGAIVHYRPLENDASAISAAELGDGQHDVFLIDSGGQYMDGTTDITRTVFIGGELAIDPDFRRDYTLVLKAHIALASAEFRYGVAGAHLDALPRRVLWPYGLDYAHGTGHGVGYVLNVHEAPPNISAAPRNNPANLTPIEPNMVFSNEPGLYRAGRYGIRIENLVRPYIYRENEFGKFLKLETLTLCPIDLRPVLPELLTDAEKDWLTSYHREVYERLAPNLTSKEQTWLANCITNFALNKPN